MRRDQRRLIGNRTADDSRAVVLMAESQTVEPGCPALVEMPGKANLIPSGAGLATVRGVVVVHSPPRACSHPCLRPAVPVRSAEVHGGGRGDERASPEVVSRVVILRRGEWSRVPGGGRGGGTTRSGDERRSATAARARRLAERQPAGC